MSASLLAIGALQHQKTNPDGCDRILDEVQCPDETGYQATFRCSACGNFVGWARLCEQHVAEVRSTTVLQCHLCREIAVRVAEVRSL